MSHFTLLVIGDDIEQQLAPFDEQLETEPYLSYLETDVLDRALTYYKDNPGDMDESMDLTKPLEILTNFYGEEVFQNEDGFYTMSTYNPKSKWDWYTVGGRWDGELLLKQTVNPDKYERATASAKTILGDPIFVNSALKKDIDWEAMQAASKEKHQEYWDTIHKIVQEISDPAERQSALFKAGFWMDEDVMNMSREDYAQLKSGFSTFAILKDGQWYEKGQMGWFGMSRNNLASDEWDMETNLLLESLPEDTLITLVDCHI